MKYKGITRSAALTTLAVLSAGCTGIPYKMAAVEPDLTKYEILGPASGKGRGFMILNLIPVGQNSKIEKAVETAIQSKGGDELIDISVQESWFWAYVLNSYAVEVQGTVLKKKTEAGSK
ncbi:MAG: hypothetical protein WEF50_22070 [Myxococcota bacterium]